MATAMNRERRSFIAGMERTILAIAVQDYTQTNGGRKMHGLIGKMTAASGKRDTLIANPA
jgi:hypothetical protein